MSAQRLMRRPALRSCSTCDGKKESGIRDTSARDTRANRLIVASAVGPAGEEPPAIGAAELFESRMVSDPTRERHVLLVEIGQLAAFLQSLRTSSVTLEHIYDY